MHLNVFFTPSAIVNSEASTNDVYIVIDVIRATTTQSVMFDQGATRVLVASTVEEAKEAAQKIPGRLLCGERNVQPVPGFDYGNSPVQFSQIDLTERELIMTTTNGTRAFYACPQDATRLAGSFYNAEAVALKALEMAKDNDGDIHLVCAGELGYFALDDAVCAGFLALELHRLQGQVLPLDLHESVLAAISLYEAFEPPKVIDYCNSAQAVILGGLPDDPPFCMRMSVSQSVPMVVGKESETGLLVIERS
ncbi:MAG TPA: 2-phosphosulfolactate phosphatase [Ktedonobacteraceae bacterium]|nr:2-phosphosulfolactate phosphatase [Ktedonobacteraceae bacterium]